MLEGDTGKRDVVLDLEAGLEVMSRATPRYVDVLLAVVEPYFRSLEAGKRVVELAKGLEVPRVYVVANKVRSEADAAAIESFCDNHDLELIRSIPFDEGLIEAERAGKAPIDYDPASPAVSEIRELAGVLLAG
ncbi:MAG: hypothetical protein ACR2GQ_10785 [Gemmatimonadota bacterium]|jgi:CO dehydrogenase maturation factor